MQHSLITTAIICVGGIYLLVAPFVVPAYRRLPTWLKAAMLIAGVMAESSVALNLFISHVGQGNRWYPLLTHLHSMMLGATIGLLLAYLLFSFFDYQQRGRGNTPVA